MLRGLGLLQGGYFGFFFRQFSGGLGALRLKILDFFAQRGHLLLFLFL